MTETLYKKDTDGQNNKKTPLRSLSVNRFGKRVAAVCLLFAFLFAAYDYSKPEKGEERLSELEARVLFPFG